MNYLITLSIASFLLATSLEAASPNVPVDRSRLIKQICDNTRKPSQELATLQELADVVEVISNDNGSLPCPNRIKSAIIDLQLLIDEHENDVCSQASADAIVGYYERYLASKDPETKALIEFPKAMKKFFISYGLKVSSFCRKQVVGQLVEASDKYLDNNDFEELSQFTGHKAEGKGFIALFVSDPKEEKSYKDLVLPKLFVQMMDMLKSSPVSKNNEKIFLEIATTTRISRLQAHCNRRLKPIYKDLLLPLVTLSLVGFNYKGEEQKRDLAFNSKVYEWYRIVFLCEALNGIEFFKMSEEELQAAGPDRKLVRLLDEDEAEKMRAQRDNNEQNSVGLVDDLQPIEYKPQLQSMPLPDVMYDKRDSSLNNAVMSFKRKARAQNDPDLVRRLADFAKKKISSRGIKILRKVSGIKSLPENGKIKTVDLVHFVEEYQHALEKGNPNPVAGYWGDPLQMGLTVVALLLLIGALAVLFATGAIG